jgi:Domain of unknown function (DUF4129)
MRWRPPRSPDPRPARSQSTKPRADLAGLAVLLLAVALEALPVTAWLETGAAINAGTPRQAAVPFWFVYFVVLTATLLGQLSTRPRMPSAVVPVLIFVGWLAALLVALRLAPGAYAPVAPHGLFALGWLAQLVPDISFGSDRLGVGVGLVALNTYLWWRGLSLGRGGPQYDRLWFVFRFGLAGIVFAIGADAALHGAGRAGLGADLAVLLPVEVGAGLVALTLLQVAAFARSRTGRDSDTRGAEGVFEQTPWLLTALVLSGAVVLAALLLALALSYNTLQAIAQALRPVGDALGAAVQWLVEAVAFVLFWVFYWPIAWLQQLVAKNAKNTQFGNSGPPLKPPRSITHPAQGIPAEWLLVGRWVFFIVMGVVALYVLYRILQRLSEHPRPDDADETREALDARSLLGAQLRALFAGRRRAAAAEVDEALARHGIRRLYRDVLRAALRAGRGRGPAETPAEYERRLAVESRDVAEAVGDSEALPVGDLEGLSRMYEQARYGEQPDEPATDEARARERRLSAWLGRHRAR